MGPRLLWLKGLKCCGECKPSVSFDFDTQKRASPLRMTFWVEAKLEGAADDARADIDQTSALSSTKPEQT